MSSNTIETGCHDNANPPAVVPFDVRHLTTAQLQVLGLPWLAYLTATRSAEGVVDYVIYAADGMPVAAVDEFDLALDLVDHLGMTLTPVH
jgi:hypothetical protein